MPSPDIKVTIRFEVVSPAGEPVDAVDEVHRLAKELTEHGFAVAAFGPFANDDGTVSDGFEVHPSPQESPILWQVEPAGGFFSAYLRRANEG